MRKPKIHPRFFINLVGTNFRERWNVVEHATKDELENYISNTKHIKKIKIEHWGKNWWQQKQMTINESVQNTYMRKIWRIRHSKTFKKDVIYRVDRNIARWNTKLGPTTGEGFATTYQFERERKHSLNKGDLLTLTKVDEMGNLYFIKIDNVTAPHPYVLNRENANLAYHVPVEA